MFIFLTDLEALDLVHGKAGGLCDLIKVNISVGVSTSHPSGGCGELKQAECESCVYLCECCVYVCECCVSVV